MAEGIKLKPQTDLKLWKTYMIMWISTQLRKLLERIQKFQPKAVYVIINTEEVKAMV
jgi:hypothetical protein